MQAPLVHGKRATYTKRKCRCDKCKEANAKYKLDKTTYYRSLHQASATQSISADAQDFLSELAHGLPTTYEWYGCRCRQCKEGYRLDRKLRELLKV